MCLIELLVMREMVLLVPLRLFFARDSALKDCARGKQQRLYFFTRSARAGRIAFSHIILMYG